MTSALSETGSVACVALKNETSERIPLEERAREREREAGVVRLQPHLLILQHLYSTF